MASVVRSVLSVLAGFIVASIVMMAVEFTNGHYLYPELGKAAEGLTDREALRQVVAAAPVGALLVVIVGWVLGGVAGGFVAARVTRRAATGHALALGILLTCAGAANNLMIPPPLWFWIAGFVAFIPAAYVGGQLAAGKK